MKYTIICTLLLMLSGCSLDPRFQTALNNYAKDNCNGKLLYVGTATFDGTVSSNMFYQCVEDTGVKNYAVKIADIPQKYWEIE